MKVLDKTNAIWGAVSTVLAALLGAYWFLFLAFFVLNIVDYITGFTKAKFFEKNESSAVGAKGVVKKVMYWVVVGIAFFMSDCFINPVFDCFNNLWNCMDQISIVDNKKLCVV